MPSLSSKQKDVPAGLALVYLGFLGAIQGADPNIASTALLSAATELKMGNLTALAASVSTLALAASVISTGMLADRLGRKKVISVAMLLAVLGGVVVAIAQDPWMYIAGRTLAGIALGTIFGAGFAYIKFFSRNVKGGVPAALGTFSAAIGLFSLLITFAGSALIGESWRIAFLVVPVLSVLSLLIGAVVLPKDVKQMANGKSWDIRGQILLGLAIVLSLYGISHASNGLTSFLTIGPVLGGLALFAVFYVVEKRSEATSFFPVRLLKDPLFLAAIGVGFLYNFATGVGLLSFSNLFQYQLSLTGLDLALSQLPYLVAAIPVALITGKLLSTRVITRQFSALIGAFVSAGGALLFAFTALSSPTSTLEYMPALVLLGAGAGIPAVAYGGMILESADEEHYGVVSSSRTTIGQFWYALGLAASTVIIDTLARSHVGLKLGPAAEAQLDQWSASGTAPTDPTVLPGALEGFIQGFSALMVLFAVSMVLVGFLVMLLGNRSDRAKKEASRDSSPETLDS